MLRGSFRHPVRIVPLAFLVTIIVGTGLLMLPVARAGPGSASPLQALFTATSAVSVTGLVVVDTGTFWSPFGHWVILALMQVGGFGIIALATLLGLLVAGQLGLASRVLARAETNSRTLRVSDMRGIVLRIAATMLVVELIVAAVLTARLWLGYDYPFAKALWHGTFHSVSAFVNGGFVFHRNGLIGYNTDGVVMLSVSVAVLIGSIGFPVLFELFPKLPRPHRWSVHTKLTVLTTAVLMSFATITFLIGEWANPATLGPMDWPHKLSNAVFDATAARTAGFNAVDYGGVTPETIMSTYVLMFIGGGSGGAAGGIRVTTFSLLAFAIWAEVRGDRDVNVFHRRVEPQVIRQALTIALLGVAVVVGGTMIMLPLTHHRLDQVLFEVISAACTGGLSMGITADLSPVAQSVLVALMYIGRVGTITVASALALRASHRLYRLPEERPIIG